MELLFGCLVFVTALAGGSSLWSLSSHLTNKELSFNIEHNSNSVRVEAFVNDLSLKLEVSPTNVKFLLFTRHFQEGIVLQINDTMKLLNSGFRFDAETKILIHGFANSASSTFTTLMKNAYMKKNVYNIIVVDWSALCIPPFYSSAVDNASKVGVATTELVLWLVSRGLSLSSTHILGHSVGAHIAGIVGRTITRQGQGKLSRITGLDPAKPMFEGEAASFRLSSADAEFVDCVHTCGGFLGVSEPSCHTDFYPNGGTSPQPGCQFDFFGICSHQRAYNYYVESIDHPNSFKAVRCSTVENYSPSNCSSHPNKIMGEHSNPKSQGIFYATTASQSPFSLKVSTAFVSPIERFSWYFI